MDKVPQESKLCHAGHDSRPGDKYIHGQPIVHELKFRKGVVPSGYPIDPHKMHREEDKISTDEGHPKMEITQSFIHHPSKQFRKPVVRTGQQPENDGTLQQQVKASDDKKRTMQVD